MPFVITSSIPRFAGSGRVTVSPTSGRSEVGFFQLRPIFPDDQIVCGHIFRLRLRREIHAFLQNLSQQVPKHEAVIVTTQLPYRVRDLRRILRFKVVAIFLQPVRSGGDITLLDEVVRVEDEVVDRGVQRVISVERRADTRRGSSFAGRIFVRLYRNDVESKSAG